MSNSPSSTDHKLIGIVISLGGTIYSFPFKWDTNTGSLQRLKTKKEIFFWIMTSLIDFIYRLSRSIFAGYLYWSGQLNEMECIFQIFLFATFIAGHGLILPTLLKSELCQNIWNNYFQLKKQLEEYHIVKPLANKKNNMDRFGEIIVWIQYSIPVFMVLNVLFNPDSTKYVYPSLDRKNYSVLLNFLTVGETLSAINGFTVGLFYILIYMDYFSFHIFWMNKLNGIVLSTSTQIILKNPEQSDTINPSSKQYTHRMINISSAIHIYRMFKIFNIKYNEFGSCSLAIIICGLVSLNTTTIFASVVMLQIMPPLEYTLLLILTLIFLLIDAVTLQLMGSFYNNSINFLHSKNYLKYKSHTYKELLSLSPCAIQVGSFGFLTTSVAFYILLTIIENSNSLLISVNVT